jgi:hypothetical protein
MTSRLGSCGVWLTVRRGMECIVGCGDARISDAGIPWRLLAIKRCAGRAKAATGSLNAAGQAAAALLRVSYRLRHAIGTKMGLRRMEEGFGAPTRGM